MSEILFDQTDNDAAASPVRSIAQKFKPTISGEITSVSVNVRTSAFDGAGSRSKRVVVLNADRSSRLGQSAWSTTAFTEGTEAAWNELALEDPVAFGIGAEIWLGVEFQNSDATEDRLQFRSSADDVGVFYRSDEPSEPERIHVPAGNSASLLDAVDGTNVIYTSVLTGMYAIRAIGDLGAQKEGWGMLI